jgi:hypothetical protein
MHFCMTTLTHVSLSVEVASLACVSARQTLELALLRRSLRLVTSRLRRFYRQSVTTYVGYVGFTPARYVGYVGLVRPLLK